MPDAKKWLVTSTPERLSEVAAALPGAGLAIEQRLDQVGVIVCRGDEAAAGRARAIPGVSDVSSDVPIDIGPPDSDTTW